MRTVSKRRGGPNITVISHDEIIGDVMTGRRGSGRQKHQAAPGNELLRVSSSPSLITEHVGARQA
jgi:hypothetical protein